MVDCNGRSGLSLLIESALIEQNVDEYASIFFTFSQIKQFATQKQFRKFNRQYLKNQQTVLSSPDSPCQTVLKFPRNSCQTVLNLFGSLFTPAEMEVSCLIPSVMVKIQQATCTIYFNFDHYPCCRPQMTMPPVANCQRSALDTGGTPLFS